MHVPNVPIEGRRIGCGESYVIGNFRVVDGEAISVETCLNRAEMVESGVNMRT